MTGQGGIWSDFRAGVVTMLPVVAVALPIGLLYGTLVAAKGLSPLEAGLTSALVFAGASQFVAADLWREPVPWLLLGFTAFVVNIRHVLMGASLGRHLGLFPGWMKPLVMYFMTDETWAFAERQARQGVLSPAFYWGSALALWVQWVAGTVAGAALGRNIGDPARFGFDFAFTAMFIVIVTGFWTGYRTGAVLLASGLVAALAKLAVPGAWYIILGGLAGIAVAALMHRDEASHDA